MFLKAVKSDRNSRVERCSGVRTSNEDHSTQGSSDGEAAHPSITVTSESRSRILNKKVGHYEDCSAHGFDNKRLPEGGLRFKYGELFNVFRVALCNDAHI